MGARGTRYIPAFSRSARSARSRKASSKSASLSASFLSGQNGHSHPSPWTLARNLSKRAFCSAVNTSGAFITHLPFEFEGCGRVSGLKSSRVPEIRPQLRTIHLPIWRPVGRVIHGFHRRSQPVSFDSLTLEAVYNLLPR